jgi:hypothetical protein
MSHPQDFESSLAGLDTMVVHFNHDRSCPSPTVSAASTSLDGISYVRVPRSRKRDVSRRRGSRSPFVDKSHDINVVRDILHLVLILTHIDPQKNYRILQTLQVIAIPLP